MCENTKFTKGHWTTQYKDRGNDELVVRAEDGSIVADLPYHSSAANANLIAAAPELLRALEAAYSELAYLIRHDLIPQSEFQRLGNLQAEMTCAILKAKGE